LKHVRPILYLQEEGEIVKVKMVGKRWIVVGAKQVIIDKGSLVVQEET